MPYRETVEKLRRQGYTRPDKQCRKKIKSLKKSYKDAVDRLRRSGVGVESDDDLDKLDSKSCTRPRASCARPTGYGPKLACRGHPDSGRAGNTQAYAWARPGYIYRRDCLS